MKETFKKIRATKNNDMDKTSKVSPIDTKQSVLDLSKCKAWSTKILNVIQRVFPIDLVDTVCTIPAEEMYEDTMAYFIDVYNEYFRTSVELSDVEQLLDQEIMKSYRVIKAFHACRTSNVDSYRSRGILRLSESLISELAHLAFGEHSCHVRIDTAVQRLEIRDHERCVFFFVDKNQIRSSQQNHYLQSGSEKLQRLSHDLGLGFMGILADQGEPYLIECEIPLNRVASSPRCSIWCELVTMVFRKMSSNNSKHIFSPDSCIWIKDDIPPNWIKKFGKIEERNINYNPRNRN
jgi:hypothetical protein